MFNNFYAGKKVLVTGHMALKAVGCVIGWFLSVLRLGGVRRDTN